MTDISSGQQVLMRTMTQADVPLGMRLKTQAGWNQTRADWQRFITLSPQGCFVASVNGVDVGTAATFIFENIGWIAMILVDPSARGQGVGSAMMNHCLGYLAANDVTTIRLDATDLGKPVYDKLGFVDQFKLVRYEGSLPTNEPSHVAGDCTVLALVPAMLNDLLRCDLNTTKTDRSKLLTLLAEESGNHDGRAWVARQNGAITGFCLTRKGAQAAFIGPCIATTVEAGLSLLDTASEHYAGQRVLVDIPTNHAAATAWAKRNNLSEQRQLTRMCKGTVVQENMDQLWASSGPEKG